MSDANFIPANRLAKKHCKARLRTWTAICGTYLILLALLILSAYLLWGTDDDSVIEGLKSTTERIEKYSSTISELQQKLAKATAELEASKAISQKPDWSKLLILVGDELKEEIVLNNCQLSTLNKNYTDVTNNLKELLSFSSSGMLLAERQYRLELNGFGRTQTSVSQFVLRLEQMQIFNSVRLVNSNRKALLNNEAVSFSIECNI